MNSCRKHGSTLTKYPCICGLCLMREFRQKHEEKCNYTVQVPITSWKADEFLTGSSYYGGWQEGAMHGYGEYTFPNGAIYEGEFHEGAFHGKGKLRYQTHAGMVVICGQWYKGLMTKRTLLFDGALEYDPKDWQYCKMPDRRYKREYVDGVTTSGKSLTTAYQPSVDVPEGCYDTGDGFFDITRKTIFKYDDNTKVERAPGLSEQRWIQDNCRTGKEDMIIGPRPDFDEKCTKLLEPVPPPPVNFRTITRRASTFEKYENLDDAPVFYDASKASRPPERKFQQLGPDLPTVATGHE